MRPAFPEAFTATSISSQQGWLELSPSGRLQITARKPSAAIAETSSARICGATESSSGIFRISIHFSLKATLDPASAPDTGPDLADNQFPQRLSGAPPRGGRGPKSLFF